MFTDSDRVPAITGAHSLGPRPGSGFTLPAAARLDTDASQGGPAPLASVAVACVATAFTRPARRRAVGRLSCFSAPPPVSLPDCLGGAGHSLCGLASPRPARLRSPHPARGQALALPGLRPEFTRPALAVDRLAGAAASPGVTALAALPCGAASGRPSSALSGCAVTHLCRPGRGSGSGPAPLALPGPTSAPHGFTVRALSDSAGPVLALY